MGTMGTGNWGSWGDGGYIQAGGLLVGARDGRLELGKDVGHGGGVEDGFEERMTPGGACRKYGTGRGAGRLIIITTGSRQRVQERTKGWQPREGPSALARIWQLGAGSSHGLTAAGMQLCTP